MPQVLNFYKCNPKNPPGSVYIGRGRGSEWGNPFPINATTTRAEAVEQHKKWFLARPELMLKAQQELRGLDLVCFCAPLPCHGDILLSVANTSPNA